VPSHSPETGLGPGWTEKVLPTRLECIRDPEREVVSRLRDLGYDEDHRFAVRLALEEALVNAMKHGNRMDPARRVVLAYRLSPERVEIRVRDEGAGFDPGMVPDPTRDENLQRPCGRGIMLMRSYMDEVSFVCSGQEVQMVKHRKPRWGCAMKINTHTAAGCHVVEIEGSADINASTALREALLGAIESGATKIICDLGRTTFISSDALGVLITAYLKARGRGGFVRLADPQEHLRDVLKTTRLDHLFEIFTDVKCAAAKP